jgi:uncharacterized protein YkwD
MKAKNHVRAGLAVAAALLLAAPPQPPALQAQGISSLFRRSPYDARAEEELVALLNRERSAAGVPGLALDEGLREAARRHTAEMARLGRLAHQLPGQPGLRERLGQAGASADLVAENVVYNADARSAHAGLMLSDEHRENILDARYDAVGIGAVKRDGRLYVTQVFARRLPQLSSEEAEELVAQSFNRARVESGGEALRYVQSERLRQLACEMAARDQLDTGVLRTDPGMDAVVAYTITQPERLPPQAARRVADASLAAFAVGVCYARSPQYPTGIHWVLLGLYH